MRPIRVGVVGAGPMGRLHARTLARLAETEKVCVLHAVVDHHEGRAESIAREFGSQASNDLGAVLSKLDAAVVCVPTSAHFAVAKELLERDVDVLVEKPFTRSIAEGRRLGALAAERRRILQVGHVEWYNPAWRDAAERAGEPRAIEVERLSPPTERGLDLDVVQDLMLHDIDWVTRWLGEEVIELEARGRAVVNDQLDEAEATLRFRTGCIVRLRASRVHSQRQRSVRIEGRKGIASADLSLQAVAVEHSETGHRRDPLEAQWVDFLEAVRSRANPDADAGVGVAALEMVDRIRNAITSTSEGANNEDDSALSG